MLDHGEEYRIIEGDNIPVLHALAAEHGECWHFCIYSPPFPSIFAYTSEAGDIGNSEDFRGDARLHLSFFFKAVRKLLKPGRVMICHCQQIAAMKRAGGRGLHDFRGLLIRLAQRAGFVYEYDWLIRKNPQAQAIRTKARSLQFAGMESDRANCRGALCDYLLKFVKPGQNEVPIDVTGEVSRNDWIDWAEGCWNDVKETDTLNVKEARQPGDVRHICPLQLEIYHRCIRLFSNPGEVVGDPFCGIGSCGFTALGGTSPTTKKAIQEPRRMVGIELNPPWAELARMNCERAIKDRKARQRTLWDTLPEPDESPDTILELEKQA